MKRILGIATLGAFMAYTMVFLFVYLTRSFRVDAPANLEFVGIWHGDNFSRVLLVAILFLIGEVFAVYLALASRQPKRLSIRSDLWQWLRSREDLTGEPADVLAERAIANYRVRLEGGEHARLPSAPIASAGTPQFRTPG